MSFTSELRALNRGLRDAIAQCVDRAATDEGAFAAVARLILDYEELQVRRDRAFVAGTNFDVEPETLVAIPDSFALTGAGAAR